jgi:hypothetical protein
LVINPEIGMPFISALPKVPRPNFSFIENILVLESDPVIE